MYVRTYVRIGHALTLGMSICAYAQECVTETYIQYSRNSMELEDGVGGTLLGDGGQGGQRGWPFVTYVLGGVKCRNEC